MTITDSKFIGDDTCRLYLLEHTCIVSNELNQPVEIELTPTEWNILEVLLRNINHLVRYNQLTTMVWGPEYIGNTGKALHYWHVKNLRHRIQEVTGAQATPIKTIRGIGYKWSSRK